MALLRAARKVTRFARLIGVQSTSSALSGLASVRPLHNKVPWLTEISSRSTLAPHVKIPFTEMTSRPTLVPHVKPPLNGTFMFQRNLPGGKVLVSPSSPFMLQRRHFSWARNIKALQTKAKALKNDFSSSKVFKIVLFHLKGNAILLGSQFTKWVKARLTDNYWKAIAMVGLILVMVMLDSIEDWLSKSISGDGASGGVAVKISKMLLSLVQLLKFLHMEFQRLMNLEIQSLRDEMALLKADLDKQYTLRCTSPSRRSKMSWRPSRSLEMSLRQEWRLS